MHLLPYEKLLLAQVVKKLPSFMKPEDVFSSTKAVVTGSYPKPLQSTHYLFKIHYRIILQSMPRSSKQSLPFNFFNKNVLWISHLSYSCYMQAYVLDLKLSCGDYKQLDLLGCNAVQSGRRPPTFRENISPPSLDQKSMLTKETYIINSEGF